MPEGAELMSIIQERELEKVNAFYLQKEAEVRRMYVGLQSGWRLIRSL